MKKLFLLIVFFIPISVFGQSDSLLFKNTFNHFQETFIWVGQKFDQERDSVTWKSLYKTNDFNVSISENPIRFETDQRIIRNPFFTEDFDDYDDNYINYPVSYSVIYDDRLVSLFRNGKFVVHSLRDYKRDTEFEKKLNTKKFSYHWLIDGKLYARSKNWLFSRLLVWSEGRWVKGKIDLPIKNQPLLFDDEKFLVFNDCFGEWGGTIYFYDRATGGIYYTESTCTNTVLNENGNYSVLAHLGHMFGSSELKSIQEPRKLTKAKKGEVNKTKNGHALGLTDESGAFEKNLEFYGILLFSTFDHNGRQIYFADINERTFLVEVKDTEIEIVHPLFDDSSGGTNPITKSYDNFTLINLDYWGVAKEHEVSVIIIDQNKITKLDWNESHSD